ncbi:CWF complex protein sap62 [Tieghemiomyces parasiticus]|uniref:CWF complex protein sap62 n=1 Tax=Tieghemiomyces parasiticus TaxID=78921 RepID=A0A9W8A893_9FUNG|nr:CWF complex protein sap62 [Tieghemiomyces parasiticus]
MDFQNRAGSKPGAAGVAGTSETNVARRERLRQLALETIDIAKDPYFMKNHLGSYECKLCLTLHTNEGSYLAHTQGKKHQTNLARRAAMEAKEHGGDRRVDWNTLRRPRAGPGLGGADGNGVVPRRQVIKIGRPGYQVTKIYDPPPSRQFGFLFEIQYPEVGVDVTPRHRFMSAYEQQVEAPNRDYQYVVFAAEPYETIAFKIQSREVDKAPGRFLHYWDPDLKKYTLQFLFKNERFGGRGDREGQMRRLDERRDAPESLNPLNPYQAPSLEPTYVRH